MTHVPDNGNNNYSTAHNKKGMSHKPLESEKRNITDSFVVRRNVVSDSSEKQKNCRSCENQFS